MVYDWRRQGNALAVVDCILYEDNGNSEIGVYFTTADELAKGLKPTGTLQFIGVIPPATNTIIFVDGVADSRMNIPNDTLRLIRWNAFLFNDSTDELLADTVGSISGANQVRYLKIYPNGWNNGFSGTDFIFFDDVWNVVANTNPIVPQFRPNGVNLHEWEIYIDYTNGYNDMTFDVRLVVDVEYYDYPI